MSYEIETGFTMGLRGGGKTYDLACRVNDWFADGRTVHTINMDLRLDNIARRLRNMGKSPFDVNQVLGRSEKVFTLEHFHLLRDCSLAVDEGHFWFPQNQFAKISIDVILDMAMGRKRKVDMWAVSQLDQSINHNVRQLLEDGWLARPLKEGPIKLFALLKRRMGLSSGHAFFYVRFHDAMGGTKTRKDGSFEADDKRVRILDLSIASTYKTEEEVSSPVLDQMRERGKLEYFQEILKGETRPQSACPVCCGKRRVTIIRYPIEVLCDDGRWRTVDPLTGERFEFAAPVSSEDAEKILLWNEFASKQVRDCEACEGLGYYFPDDHEDYAAAIDYVSRYETMKNRVKTELKARSA